MVGALGWCGPQPGTGEDTAQGGNDGAKRRRLPIDGSHLHWQADSSNWKKLRGHALHGRANCEASPRRLADAKSRGGNMHMW